MAVFTSEREYVNTLTPRSVLPQGFRVSTTRLTFVPRERPSEEPYAMNLALMLADEPTQVFAGAFTSNRVQGAPVVIARERMERETMQAVLVNNKIANVCASTGREDALGLTAELARRLAVNGEDCLSASTGVIGWSLPVAEMRSALPDLIAGLHDGAAVDVARAIMTTDSFPKVRDVEVGSGRIIGIAKGAGMVEPNLATMLVFILTDVTVSREELRRALAEGVEASFNAITIDGDQSTSDMVLAMSSNRKPAIGRDAFRAGLHRVCRELAADIVRNGEGAGHVIRVRVDGAPSSDDARAVGKAVANSPLVKTAIYGNDPNVGRIVSAVGDFAGNTSMPLDPRRMRVRVGEELVFENGAFALDREKETRLSEYLAAASMNPRISGYPQHEREVAISVSLGNGAGSAQVLGSDLSHEYVRENADYRT
jgi:glutamate N-acetyltransferase/amino-acid N-acetyltransferase